MRNLDHRHRALGTFLHLEGDFLVGPNPDTGEESRKDNLASRNRTCTSRHQIARYNPHQGPQFRDIPTFLAEDSDGRTAADEGVTLPRDRLDQRRFATTIRPKNTNVLADPNLQRYVIQGDRFAPHDRNVRELD